MSLPCEKCAALLPEPTPGFSLVTCRQCGTAQLHKPRTQVTGTSEARPAHISSAFLVREEKGDLCIGWSELTLTPLWVPAVWVLSMPLLAVRDPRFVEMAQQPPLLYLLGLVTLVLTYVALAHSLNTTWVEVRGQELSVVVRPLPLPRSQAVHKRDMSSLWSRTYEQKFARYFTETRHAVFLKTREGRVLRLADNLTNEFDAEWLATRLSEHLRVPYDGRR